MSFRSATISSSSSGIGFRSLNCPRTLALHVGVGMGAASFWRGAWYLLDDNLYPDDPGQSALASLALGVVGMGASQGLVARAERLTSTQTTTMQPKSATTTAHLWRTLRASAPLALARFGALYTVAMSCVLVWRGTWLGWDCLYESSSSLSSWMRPPTERLTSSAVTALVNQEEEDQTLSSQPLSYKATDPGHATHSGLLSHAFALTALLTTGLFASVLAPPAAVSIIRDQSVQSGQRLLASSSSYRPPAQALVDRMFSSSSSQLIAKRSTKSPFLLQLPRAPRLR